MRSLFFLGLAVPVVAALSLLAPSTAHADTHVSEILATPVGLVRHVASAVHAVPSDDGYAERGIVDSDGPLPYRPKNFSINRCGSDTGYSETGIFDLL